MWAIAFIGSASAFIESTLAQIYKEKRDGEYRGGPAYYIEKGIGWKWYAVLFSIATLIAMSILMPGIQSNSIALGLENAFGLSTTVTGIGLVVLLGIIVLNFVLIRLAPGDPATVMAGEAGAADELFVQQLRKEFGLDRPFHEQLFVYVKNIASFDLGFSYRQQRPVGEVLAERVTATLLLTGAAFCLSLVAAHLSAWAEEWILWFSTEFGFIKLPDAYTTGSSIMPQKRNPDALELLRSASATAIACLDECLMLTAKLPSGYQRDLQRLKPPLFRAIDLVMDSLDIMAFVLDSVSFLPEFFESTWGLSTTVAGAAASAFAVMNLVSRPAGGLLSDVVRSRRRWLALLLLGLVPGGPSDHPEVLRAAGRALRRVHRVDLAGWGALIVRDGAARGRYPSVAAAVQAELEGVPRLVEAGILDRRLAERARALVTDGQGPADYRGPGVLLHRDLKVAHLFAEVGG